MNRAPVVSRGEAHSLALDLPFGPTRTTPFARLIAHYAAQVPTRGEVDGFAVLTAIAQGEGREKSLEITASAAAPFVRPDLIVEAPRQFLFARPRVQISEDGRRAVFEIAVDTGNKSRPLVGVPLVVTLIYGSRAIERAIVAAPGS